MNHFRIDIFNKYLEIKQDLINNLHDVFNRSHYYTHKYRGNRHTDINVALNYEGRLKVIQIFVRNDGRYVREIMKFNYDGYFVSNIKTNIYDDE